MPAHMRQTNNCGELLAILVQVLFHIALTPRDANCYIYTDSDYALQVTVGGVAERHAAYRWASKPENMGIMKLLVVLTTLLPKLRMLPVMSHTDADDVATKWNAAADDLASRGLNMDDNSRPFLDLLATVEAIDLSACKPSIAATVTEAVQNFVNQTNDNYQTREPIAPEQSLPIV